jgi:hypothetical protein
MIRTILLVCLVAGAAREARAEPKPVAGAWTAFVSDKDPEKLSFSMRTRKHENNGSTIARNAFEGLTAEQVRSHVQVTVQFALRREAGTVSYEGVFKQGQGAGTFTFASNPEYPKALKRLGVELEEPLEEQDRELFALAIFDVSTEYIRSMRAIGYDVRLEKYMTFRIFHVDPAYVKEMGSLGFKNLSADKLVETKVHGVTPAYIREMRAAGEDLTLDKYVESRIFRVTPEFAAEMAKAGYADLDRDVLVQFRVHGVTTEFIQELRKLGYTKIPAQKLVEMRIHGVTPQFIRRLADAGYKNVPIDKMIQMRIFDIQPEMVKALDDAGT